MTDDDATDPFERLGDVDREGDPFERLDDADEPAAEAGGEGSTATDEPDQSPDHQWVDPFADLDRDANGNAREAATTGNDAEPDPFEDMDEPTSDPFGGADSVFEQVDVGSVDGDDVWESITGGDEDEEPAVPDDDRYAEVSKHAFCEQCEHFSDPPNSHCTHERAEIIEYLDMERVRLLDCPVVARRQDLE